MVEPASYVVFLKKHLSDERRNNEDGKEIAVPSNDLLALLKVIVNDHPDEWHALNLVSIQGHHSLEERHCLELVYETI